MNKRKLKRIIKEEVSKLLKEAGNYDHSSNLRAKGNVSLRDLKAGDLATFTFVKSDGDKEKRQGIVLNPNYKGKLHMLDISYLSQLEVDKFYEAGRETMSQGAAELIDPSVTGKYMLGGALKRYDPQKLYHEIIKPAGLQHGYRTFNISNIDMDLIQKNEYLTR